MKLTDRRGIVVFLPADLGAGRRPLRGDEPVVVAALEPLQMPHPAPNTVVVTWARHTDVVLYGRPAHSSWSGVETCEGADLMDGVGTGRVINHLADEITGGVQTDELLLPLLYLHEVGRDLDGIQVEVYRLVERGLDDACYIRITHQPRGPIDLNGATWLDDVLELEAASSPVLNNYQAYFDKCFPGNELEHKFVLPANAPIYRLAADIASRIRHDQVPGVMLSYRDEFQTWDYVNHLYRVDGPPDARGYVSFIPTAVGGRTKQKRKWFVEDAFMRREEISDLGQMTLPFADYVRDVLGVDALAMPPFRRVRYDVNLESVASGHVFGIFIDRCTVIDDPAKVMCQCEVEYVKSRTAGPADADLAVTELDAIAIWTQRALADLGYPAERSVYSKLSFLEHASGRAPRP